ncbi:MAG: TspO/MBR family protein [Pseudomonadota bacterium]
MLDIFSWSLFVFIIACFGAAMTGAFFGPGKWYEALDKPDWRPPNWAFPVVWMILYGMIAAAGYIVWTSAAPGEATIPMIAWGVQIVLNAAWSPVFFGLRRPDLGMIAVGALWLSIALCIVAFVPVSTLAAGLMVPYLVWVSIAAALNYSVMKRNPNAHELVV